MAHKILSMNFDLSMKSTNNPIMKSLHVTMVLAACTSFTSAMPVSAEGQMNAASEAVVTPVLTTTFLESADIDGNGILDLISGVKGNTSVQIFLNSGEATQQMINVKNEGNVVNLSTAVSGLYFADLNRDRLPELITASAQGSTVIVQKNQSTTGTAVFAAEQHFTINRNAQLFFACDLNMDGYQDIIAASDNTLTIYKNTCTAKAGDINLGIANEQQLAGFINSVKCADMDGDGNIDIITSTSNGIYVLNGKGNGFNYDAAYAGDNYVAVSGMDIGDLDGDYLPEIVISHWPETQFSILRNISQAGSMRFTAENPITCAGANDIALCDYNQDGLFDILTLADGAGWHIAEVFRNKTAAQGRFIFAAPLAIPVEGNHFEISDFDNDGTDDIAAVNPLNNKVAINFNHGNSTNAVFNQFEAFCGEDGFTWMTWSVKKQSAKSKYIIEKTINGIDFVEVGSIVANQNVSNLNYEFIVNEENSLAAGYRIKTVDENNSIHYADLILIDPCDQAVTDFVCVFPNPVDKLMNFQFSVKSDLELNFEILDARMQPIMHKNASVTPGTRTYTLDIDELAKGSYLLAVRFGNLAPKVCRFEKL